VKIIVRNLLIVAIPLAVVHADDNPKDIFSNILHDQKRIATSPVRADAGDMALWGAASAGTIGLAPQWNGNRSLDKQMADSWGKASGSRKSAWEAVSEVGSGEVTFGVSIVGYGWGAWQDNSRMKRVTARWFEALVDATIWGTGLKLLAGRDRPGTSPYQGDFHGPKAASNSSMPSGHSAAAFATAAVFSHEFPTPWVVVPAYTVATGIGISRLALQQHWTSDVLVGAVLGQSIGSLVMNRDRKKNDQSASWTPWKTAHAAGLTWSRTF
jgi:membrane-associated phospholipid phosphatase